MQGEQGTEGACSREFHAPRPSPARCHYFYIISARFPRHLSLDSFHPLARFFRKDRGWDGKAAAAAESNEADGEREAELADAKETLRLLQQQTLKFSTLVVIFQVWAPLV